MTNESMDEFMDQLHAADSDGTKSEDFDDWDLASELFPRRPFPWNAFPTGIAESLKQLARSCATSDVSMPGAAMATLASVLGRTISASAKDNWYEPAIIWVADIRSSGAGKTPAVRMLLGPVYKVQGKTDELYQAELEQWNNMPKKSKGVPPKRPAGRYATDLTLEGLRMDVQQGHGGLVCVLDELSSMISSQNQFKQKGNDREAWLALWDGNPARITRASGALTINGARISMFGGIQPAIFSMVFGGGKGIYCSDGTIFRFLLTYEHNLFFRLTSESWTDENRKIWESTLENAITWSEKIISVAEWKPHILRLTEGAQKCLLEYRNKIFNDLILLPPLIQGFIPKAISYILRIASILHCMSHFVQGIPPALILNDEEIHRAISVVEFYLAHTVSALQLIDSDISPVHVNKTTSTLSKTLASLRSDLDSCRLAVGYIFEKFNEQCVPALKIKSEKAMGTLLREHGLTISNGKHNANRRRGVCCLIWDEKTDHFLRTSQTSASQSPPEETCANTGFADKADFADIAGEEFDIEGETL